MRKADSPPVQIFLLIGALIVGVVVVAVFIRGVNEAFWGACWDKAKYGFAGLKDGNNDIFLGDCIDKVYIVTRDRLDSLRTNKDVNIFSCSHTGDKEYLSFAIIKPNTNLGLTDAITDPVGSIRKGFLENFCVEYKYSFNSVSKNVLDGKKSYCVRMEKIAGSADPNAKNLNIREGGC